MIFKDSQKSKMLNKLSFKKKKCFPNRLEHGEFQEKDTARAKREGPEKP